MVLIFMKRKGKNHREKKLRWLLSLLTISVISFSSIPSAFSDLVAEPTISLTTTEEVFNFEIDYDLVGFPWGAVNESQIIGGEEITVSVPNAGDPTLEGVWEMVLHPLAIIEDSLASCQPDCNAFSHPEAYDFFASVTVTHIEPPTDPLEHGGDMAGDPVNLNASINRGSSEPDSNEPRSINAENVEVHRDNNGSHSDEGSATFLWSFSPFNETDHFTIRGVVEHTTNSIEPIPELPIGIMSLLALSLSAGAFFLRRKIT